MWPRFASKTATTARMFVAGRMDFIVAGVMHVGQAWVACSKADVMQALQKLWPQGRDDASTKMLSQMAHESVSLISP